MMFKINCDLLRPFNPDDVKVGDKCCWWGDGTPMEFLGPYVNEGGFVFRFLGGLSEGKIGEYTSEQVRALPFCWVEDKPVYKGDRLWHTGAEEFVTALEARKDDKPGFVCSDGDWVHTANLIWKSEPKKVEFLGWMDSNGQLQLVSDSCPVLASWKRVPDADVEYTVEEYSTDGVGNV